MDSDDLAEWSDQELAHRLDVLRIEELRRLGGSGDDVRRTRFYQQTEELATLGILARGLAHEFNNLFSGVIAHCDYALQSSDAEAKQRALEVALASTRAATVIVKNIQSFARQELGHSEPTDPVEVVLDAVRLLAPSLKTSRQEVVPRYETVPPFVLDAAAIRQVVLNLLTNAMQASPQGATIEVSVRAEGESCVIEVIDHGIGIPRENLERIFAPFFSTKGVYARTEAESRVQGTGLGLAVSYGIVRQHGGTIEVESTVGVGSRFRVRLPRRAAATEALP